MSATPDQASIRKVLPGAVIAFTWIAFTGCCSIHDGKFPPPNPEQAAFEKALQEIEQLHAGAVDRSFLALGLEQREIADHFFRERSEDPRILPLQFTAAGTVRALNAPGFRVRPEDLGLGSQEPAEKVADALLSRYAALWRVAPETFAEAARRRRRYAPPDTRAVSSFEYGQLYRGLPVVGGVISVQVEEGSNAVIGITGSFLPVRNLSTSPGLDAKAAVASLPLVPEERALSPRLVVWSDFFSGDDAEPRLAWRVRVVDRSGDSLREVYLDAAKSGQILAESPLHADSLRRSLWDLRGLANTGSDTCQRWQMLPPYSSYPDELTGCAGSGCALCRSDPRDCALCACAHPPYDPADCAATIWRYDEAAGCAADGNPLGEGPCDTEATALWAQSTVAYDYWSRSFGRDSWDGAGGWLWLKVNPRPEDFTPAGRAQPKWVDDDEEYDLVQVTIHDGNSGIPQLVGHELGHALQYGSYTYADSSGFHGQGVDVVEHNADAHGFRYRGLTLGEDSPSYRCALADGDLRHYTQFHSIPGGQANKFIGNCHGWLMSQDTGHPIVHHGVEVSAVSPALYDQIWFRNLDLYFRTSDSYFDWWNDMVAAAYSGYGYGPAYYAAQGAADAIGSWTGFKGVGSGIRSEDRIAMAGWRGASRGPCAFYRPSGSTAAILWQCYTPGGWTNPAAFNDPGVDPAASEAAAAVVHEPSGAKIIYVLWRGTDNRIRYRRFDVDSFSVGRPAALGASHLTLGVPAAAALASGVAGAGDRLIVVYHPLGHPTRFHSTYLGSAEPGHDLGASLDSDAPPALAAFPYPDRVVFIRPDFATGRTPRHLRYATYSMARGGSWNIPSENDLTALFEVDPHTPRGMTRTDRGVALATYGPMLGEEKLRIFFVTLGDKAGAGRELWYASLKEFVPGTGLLWPVVGTRAVPLAPLTRNSSQSAGGAAEGVPGHPLWHLWGQGGPIPKLYEWRTYSD